MPGDNSCSKTSQDGILKNSPSVKGWQPQADGVVKWNELPFNPNLKEKAKELRKAGNLSEVLIWNQIKNKQFLGLDFDRQKIIGNYIVDFYCKNLGVVIEIDGVSHDGKIEYDLERDAYLKKLGLKVIHISDLDVKKNLEGVLEYLKNELNTPSANADTPLQEGNLLERILNHPNIYTQIKEWQELGIVDNDFKVSDIFENSPSVKGWQAKPDGVVLNPKYKHLPIDTKYFKDLELEILSLFDDGSNSLTTGLDKSLDGWLIKSENYQALNTILPKFKEKVQTIYIDPPFNLDSSDQFMYRTNYKDANWATLLENRLRIAKEWLNEKGSIFVRCDYNGNWIVRCLMDDIFNNNLKNEIAVKRTRTLKGESGRFHTAWESLYFYGKSENIMFNGFRKLKPESEWQWVEMHLPGTRKDEDLLYRNFFGKRLKAPEGRRWALSQEALDDAISKGLVKMDEQTGMPKFLTKWETLGSNWTDISGYSPTYDFTTENSEELLQRAIESSSNKTNLILDFFLGSGTTTAVAHKLGRKWIGVEMGEHFYSVVLPRMKKVLAYDKSGISKELKTPCQTSSDTPLKEGNYYEGGGFFKYYELEQYEETLANCKYEDGDLFNSPLIKGWTAEGRTGYWSDRSPYQEYVFLKDEKMLKALEIDYENNKVKVDLSKLYPNIDIAETLSNLTGKWIKKISDSEVKFEDGTKINTKDLDYKLIKPLLWW
jgi:very-short-patch-repair endonuclease/DNA modification methylase